MRTPILLLVVFTPALAFAQDPPKRIAVGDVPLAAGETVTVRYSNDWAGTSTRRERQDGYPVTTLRGPREGGVVLERVVEVLMTGDSGAIERTRVTYLSDRSHQDGRDRNRPGIEGTFEVEHVGSRPRGFQLGRVFKVTVDGARPLHMSGGSKGYHVAFEDWRAFRLIRLVRDIVPGEVQVGQRLVASDELLRHLLRLRLDDGSRVDVHEAQLIVRGLTEPARGAASLEIGLKLRACNKVDRLPFEAAGGTGLLKVDPRTGRLQSIQLSTTRDFNRGREGKRIAEHVSGDRVWTVSYAPAKKP